MENAKMRASSVLALGERLKSFRVEKTSPNRRRSWFDLDAFDSQRYGRDDVTDRVADKV